MKIPLSKRLMACCQYVKPGDRVADIGCDHGYLSIYLLKSGIVSSVIASDVKEQPLHSAMINAEKFGVRDKITFLLSDGVQKLPRDFDTMICAGMGGDTMCSILKDAPWLRNPKYRLILQCQSRTPMLRRYLSDAGWCISRETVLRDGRFLYTVMDVIYDPENAFLSDTECYLSPALLRDSAPEVAAYYAWIIRQLRVSVAGTKDAAKASILKELEENPKYNPYKEVSHG